MEEDLKAFTSGDTDQARGALDRLARKSRPYLLNWLKPRTRDTMHAEEIAQGALTRVWEARDKYRNQGVSRWFAYLKRIGSNLIYDEYRIPYKEVEWEEGLLSSDDRSFPEDVHLALLAQRAYWLANLLWLGLDGSVSAGVHDRQLLVALRYYLDGEPLSDILTSMPSPPADEPPLTLKLLNGWVRHPGVLRYFIFRRLYYGNERLALHVLGLDETEGGYELLDTLVTRFETRSISDLEIEGHSGQTVAIALWRYRSALTPDQIRSKYGETLSEWQVDQSQFSEVCALLAAREPFRERVGELQCAFQDRNSTQGTDLLRDAGPWRRLVFQYEYHDDVPLAEIARRVQVPAEVAGFRLTTDMINSWTNGKQLCRQLAKYWRATFEGDFDE